MAEKLDQSELGKFKELLISIEELLISHSTQIDAVTQILVEKDIITNDELSAKQLNIMLPEELMERIQTLCAERDMTIQDFATDAIIEKLELAHKERRKKSRL